MLVSLADTWSEGWTLDRGGWLEPRDRRRSRIFWRRRSRIFLRRRNRKLQKPGQNPGLLAFAANTNLSTQ